MVLVLMLKLLSLISNLMSCIVWCCLARVREDVHENTCKRILRCLRSDCFCYERSWAACVPSSEYCLLEDLGYWLQYLSRKVNEIPYWDLQEDALFL